MASRHPCDPVVAEHRVWILAIDLSIARVSNLPDPISLGNGRVWVGCPEPVGALFVGDLDSRIGAGCHASHSRIFNVASRDRLWRPPTKRRTHSLVGEGELDLVGHPLLFSHDCRIALDGFTHLARVGSLRGVGFWTRVSPVGSRISSARWNQRASSTRRALCVVLSTRGESLFRWVRDCLRRRWVFGDRTFLASMRPTPKDTGGTLVRLDSLSTASLSHTFCNPRLPVGALLILDDFRQRASFEPKKGAEIGEILGDSLGTPRVVSDIQRGCCSGRFTAKGGLHGLFLRCICWNFP